MVERFNSLDRRLRAAERRLEMSKAADGRWLPEAA
jgi:hypothetical protein